MEKTNSTQATTIQKRVNIKFCLIETWKLFAMYTTCFFKQLWLHLFVAAIGFALFVCISTNFYVQHILPAYLYENSGIDASLSKALFEPGVTDIFALAVSFLAFILANSMMFGALSTQIRFYHATDELPCSGCYTFWNEIKKDGYRSLFYDLILFAACIAIISFFAFVCIKTYNWVALFSLPILMYILIVGNNAKMLNIFSSLDRKRSIAEALRLSHRKLGAYIILALLTGLPLLAIFFIVMHPIAIMQASTGANEMSVLAGDPSGIPSIVQPLFAFVSFIGYCIFGVAFALQYWVMALYTTAQYQSLRENRV